MDLTILDAQSMYKLVELKQSYVSSIIIKSITLPFTLFKNAETFTLLRHLNVEKLIINIHYISRDDDIQINGDRKTLNMGFLKLHLIPSCVKYLAIDTTTS